MIDGLFLVLLIIGLDTIGCAIRLRGYLENQYVAVAECVEEPPTFG